MITYTISKIIPYVSTYNNLNNVIFSLEITVNAIHQSTGISIFETKICPLLIDVEYSEENPFVDFYDWTAEYALEVAESAAIECGFYSEIEEKLTELINQPKPKRFNFNLFSVDDTVQNIGIGVVQAADTSLL
jgi:hypothetical protein